MIQRIQSLLLAVAALGIILLFRFPIATYTAETPGQGYYVNAELNLIPQSNPAMLQQIEAGSGEINMDQSLGEMAMWPLMALALVVAAIALAGIFMYKNRIRQMRWVSIAFVLNIIYVGLIFLLYADKYGEKVLAFAQGFMVDNLHITYAAGTWIPIGTLVLLFFAQRAIRRDEMKVRAADRLR